MVISKVIFKEAVTTKIPPEMVSTFASADDQRILPSYLKVRRLVEEGKAKFKAGDYPKAEEAYRKAYQASLETGDKYIQSLCLRLVGAAIVSQKRFEEALLSFEKALELDPESISAWHARGSVLHELKRYEEALSSFEKALGFEPKNALSWVGKGCALMGLERYEEARESFERALSLREGLIDKGTALFAPQSQLVLIRGVESIFSKDMKKAEERALEFIQLRKEAEKDNMAQAIEKAVAEFKTALVEKGVKPFAEFEVLLTVLAVDDPLERWKALGEKISQKWPKGLSAVEAIRKERE